jgi:hypothetical protein
MEDLLAAIDERGLRHERSTGPLLRRLDIREAAAAESVHAGSRSAAA